MTCMLGMYDEISHAMEKTKTDQIILKKINTKTVDYLHLALFCCYPSYMLTASEASQAKSSLNPALVPCKRGRHLTGTRSFRCGTSHHATIGCGCLRISREI